MNNNTRVYNVFGVRFKRRWGKMGYVQRGVESNAREILSSNCLAAGAGAMRC